MLDRICRACGRHFEGGPRAWYCPECRADRKAKHKSEYLIRKKTGQVREIGSTDICVSCGETYTVSGGLQKYCEKCAPKMLREADRDQGLVYYHQNKSMINPVRNARRRITKHCERCGREIPGAGGRRFCPDCEREGRRSLYKEVSETRSIMRRGSSYIVKVFAGGKSIFIKSTTDLKTAIALRDMAEEKIRKGLFYEWLAGFKANGRKID